MVRRIVITAGKAQFQARLNDTATALAVLEALPVEAPANRWGGAREVVEPGELGYWPPGSAFCIFFGRTPASRKDEIRAASPVNILGCIEGELDELWNVPDGAAVSLREFSEPSV
jgi:hypothetical protein